MSLFDQGEQQARERHEKMVADFIAKYEREHPGVTLTYHGKITVDRELLLPRPNHARELE